MIEKQKSQKLAGPGKVHPLNAPGRKLSESG
jgi:hypothetical protein